MDYAIQLLLPVIGGLMLGMWLNKTYGVPSIWAVILAILGMIGGIGILYRRFSQPRVDVKDMKNLSSHPKRTRTPAEGTQKTAHLKELDFLYHDYDHEKDDWKELDDLDADGPFSETQSPSPRSTPQPKDDSERHDL